MKKAVRFSTWLLVAAILTLCFGTVSFAEVTFSAGGKTQASYDKVAGIAMYGSAYDERGMPAYGYVYVMITTSLGSDTQKGPLFCGDAPMPVRTKDIDIAENEGGIVTVWVSAQ